MELHNKNTTLVKDIIIGMSDGLSAGTIAVSYLVGGFIPLFPYIVTHNSTTGFYVSCIATRLALIIFGIFKSKMTGRPLLIGTLKVTVTGIVAAGAAFLQAKAVS